MGFSIWVVDAPEPAELDNDEESPQAFGYPHFSTSNKGMSALLAEMQAQGMGESMPLAAFAFNDGDRITAEEISGAPSAAGELPVTASDEEMVGLWEAWMAFLRSAIPHGGIVIN